MIAILKNKALKLGVGLLNLAYVIPQVSAMIPDTAMIFVHGLSGIILLMN